MVKRIGKLIVATKKFIPVMYEFEEAQVSIINIESLGYQVLDALDNSGGVGILELGARRRLAFKIVKRMGDIIHKKLLCTAQVLPDEFIAQGLQESPLPSQLDATPTNGFK